MIDLAKVTFGEISTDGLLTLSSAADMQLRAKNKPLGFKFRYATFIK